MANTGSRTGLITGKTAFEIARWRHRVLAVLVVVSLSIAYLSNAGIPQSLFTNLLLGLLAVSGLILVVFINWAGLREDAEKKAGYTTLRFGNRQLMQRDPYMGRIIRLAGADYLDRQYFNEILDKTKAESEADKQ
ncbi:hypothetical protein [Arthrobacter sp. fls2-241-R2A-172]|uniref:hypothetical protein n=1 Tax=Arthrobacter sp. fls2-241-R2A-172 TaxID=3040325 RepID=UPI002551A8BC|nr:hypothetical protein [Arthrobacter sp. fls2-241-R2A-172]